MSRQPAATALTIGNFDGVHVGHQQLVRAAREEVGPSGRVVALTFDRHPSRVLRPEAPFANLSTIDQRRRWLEQAGADVVDELEATRDLLSQSPEAFLRKVADSHRPVVVVEGADFRFGRDRRGGVGLLHEMGPELGFRAIVIDDVEVSLIDQQIVAVSSSLIRRLLRLGRVGDASRLLGRPYTMCCEVMPGDRMGRTLGVPTANLQTGDYVLPADGVYAGAANGPDGARYPAAISVGVKPTFRGERRVCEAHLVDYTGATDEYEWTIELEFHCWLRDQLAFDDTESLVQQMQRDITRVRSVEDSKRLAAEVFV